MEIKNEAEMQKYVVEYIKERYPDGVIEEEKAFNNGTADIFISEDTMHTAIELKMSPSKRLIEQLEHHRSYADYLVGIAMKPKRKETAEKGEELFMSKQMKIFGIEDGELYLDDDFFVGNMKATEEGKYNANLKNKFSDSTLREDIEKRWASPSMDKLKKELGVK